MLYDVYNKKSRRLKKIMTRYLEQTNDYNCGPVAIANILIWAGYKTWYGRPINKRIVSGLIAKQTGCVENGCYASRVADILCRIGKINQVLVKDITYEGIVDCILKGGIVLLDFHYYYKKNMIVSHFGLLMGNTVKGKRFSLNKPFLGVNFIESCNAVQRFDHDYLKKVLKTSNYISKAKNYPTTKGWLIWKKKIKQQSLILIV